MIWFVLLVLVGAAWFARTRIFGFHGQKPDDYHEITPAFDLRTHLSGNLLCDGLIFGPTGRVTSRFSATMQGTWDGPDGVLAEEFHYDSGTRQNRAWNLTWLSNARFSAHADDIIGRAEGYVTGNTVRLTYRIVLPPEAGGHILDVVDWMYLLENGTIVNRSQFRKFGIKVAELVATIRRKDAA